MRSSYENAAFFEHKFWLQILGDHARFIRDSLYPSEKATIITAEQYVAEWDNFLQKLKDRSYQDLAVFSKEIKEAAEPFREFKLNLIERHLLGRIKIHLSPTFINHMVNELEEYLRVLEYLEKGEVPPVFHELHHHSLWLLDASGHATAINDEMDGVEQRLKNKSHLFAEHFNQFYLKAVELTGYLRTNLESFPALTRFNKEVEMEMEIFKAFLRELEEMELSAEVLSTFSALMADHMAREECYYLHKLAESTGGSPPGCDPGKPRTGS
ncbi:DUF2935 domain-containing protein [Halobacillus massiliensis]|uniref:DUF2935 domain-containing protein n=1 Tax=Halobacillus massiliensis TaxID=1926286 RepID=UPI0009E2D85F|nr:DUF2935 domain-containing protein [Halobacillus massiliensis]